MEEGDKTLNQQLALSNNKSTGPLNFGTAKVASSVMSRKWLESRPEDCILIISDDEDSDDEEMA
jgi:hypothetical protein